MRISFDKLSEGRTFPVSRGVASRLLRTIVPADLLPRFSRIHFGCNRSTTQEARLVGRGDIYEIRINFWLDRGISRIISSSPRWMEPVRQAGGIVAPGGDWVEWPGVSATRYVAFLLAHEIAHAVYAHEHGLARLPDGGSGHTEENWCDRWAADALAGIEL